MTPSCPSAIARSKNSWASSAESVTSRAHPQRLGHHGVEPARVARCVGASIRESPSWSSRSKKNGRMPGRAAVGGGRGRRVLERARPAGLVEGERLAVEDQVGGRQRPGRPRPPRASGRAISSRLRVNTDTSSPCLCTWIRMPSSLVSTANRRRPTFSTPAGRRAAVPASIGRTGRPTSMLKSASASSPPVSAARAMGPVGALNIAARRTALPVEVRRRRDRVEHHRVERALPDVAGDQVAQELLLGRGQPAEQRRPRRRAARPSSRSRTAR